MLSLSNTTKIFTNRSRIIKLNDESRSCNHVLARRSTRMRITTNRVERHEDSRQMKDTLALLIFFCLLRPYRTV